jgi:hypothetical protein
VTVTVTVGPTVTSTASSPTPLGNSPAETVGPTVTRAGPSDHHDPSQWPRGEPGSPGRRRITSRAQSESPWPGSGPLDREPPFQPSRAPAHRDICCYAYQPELVRAGRPGVSVGPARCALQNAATVTPRCKMKSAPPDSADAARPGKRRSVSAVHTAPMAPSTRQSALHLTSRWRSERAVQLWDSIRIPVLDIESQCVGLGLSSTRDSRDGAGHSR